MRSSREPAHAVNRRSGRRLVLSVIVAVDVAILVATIIDADWLNIIAAAFLTLATLSLRPWR